MALNVGLLTQQMSRVQPPDPTKRFRTVMEAQAALQGQELRGLQIEGEKSKQASAATATQQTSEEWGKVQQVFRENNGDAKKSAAQIVGMAWRNPEIPKTYQQILNDMSVIDDRTSDNEAQRTRDALEEQDRLQRRAIEENKLFMEQNKPMEISAGATVVSPKAITGNILERAMARFSSFTAPKAPTSENRTNLSPDVMLYQGKPTDVAVDNDPTSPTAGRVFLRTAQGMQDITGQATHYDRPRDADPNIAALRALDLENKTEASPGQVVFKNSGRPVGQQMPETAAARLEGIQTAIQQADVVEKALLKLGSSGAVKGYIEENGVYWPVVQDYLSPEQAAAVSETNRLLSAYAQAVSGLAVSEPEIRRLQKSAPSVKLTPEANKVILGHFKRNAIAKRDNYLNLRGWKIADAPSGGGAVEEYERGPDGKLRLKN